MASSIKRPTTNAAGEASDATTGEIVQAGEIVQEAKPDGDDLHNGFVEFHGRTVEVRAPSLEQTVIIRRLERVFSTTAKLETISAVDALALMDRALKAVTSVVVDPDEVAIIEDLWLDGEIKLEQTLPLLSAAMKALEAANVDRMNRADRRATQQRARRAKTRASLVTS